MLSNLDKGGVLTIKVFAFIFVETINSSKDNANNPNVFTEGTWEISIVYVPIKASLSNTSLVI